MELKEMAFKGSDFKDMVDTSDLSDIIIKANKISENSENIIAKSEEKIKKYSDDLKKIEKNNFKVLMIDIVIAIVSIGLMAYVTISGNCNANIVYLTFSSFCLFLSLTIVFVNGRINKLDRETLIANCITLIKVLEILKGEKK